MRTVNKRIVPLAMIAIGILFIIFGVVKFAGTAAGAKDRTETAEGVIVALEERESEDSDGHTDYTYAPVIEFFDAAGLKHQVVSPLGEEEGAHEVGESIRVSYDPADPEGNFMPEGAEGTIKLITIGACVLGVIILIAGIFRLIRSLM